MLYFTLQAKMIWRRIGGWGLNPYLAVLLMVAGYVFLSEMLFSKTEYAPHVLLLSMVAMQMRLLNKNRNEFLALTFPANQFRIIRWVENMLIALPFIISMLIHAEYVEVLMAVAVSSILIFTTTKTRTSVVIPTPFAKRPFEFIIGFRNSYVLIVLAYLLLIGSYSFQNSNWGIVSFVFLTLLILNFFSKPEDEMFVWNYSKKPSQFLLYKIIQSLRQASLLMIPMIVALLLVYPQDYIKIISFLGLAFVYIITIILAKYSAYPNEMNVPQGVLIAMSLYFPPMLIVVIPYFYIQSTKNLHFLLK
jgi:hypothetical protein